ncbi:MAG: hypothetical protein SFT81_07535 [Candidatus Caenarcaniphilales bacterium]|nr:hypothetical protein [Candidatus Caenarcaniphilales bacterium]
MKQDKVIKQKPKKVKVQSEEWFEIGKTVIAKASSQFSFFSRITQFFKKGEKKDPERELCREMIQRFDQKRLSLEEAQQLAVIAAGNLQSIQKQIPGMLFYLIGGAILTIIAIIFSILKLPPALTETISKPGLDFGLIFIFVQLLLSIIILVIGLRKRHEVEQKMLLNGVLAQSSAAFAASRNRGKGGTLFEAYCILDQIREKNKKAFDEKYGSVFKFGGK